MALPPQHVLEQYDRFPVGSYSLLIAIASAVASCHGPDVARAVFLELSTDNSFWQWLALASGAAPAAPAAEIARGAPAIRAAPLELEACVTPASSVPQWDIIDRQTGRKLIRVAAPTSDAALDRGSALLGFPSFRAAVEKMPELEGRFEVRPVVIDGQMDRRSQWPTRFPQPAKLSRQLRPFELMLRGLWSQLLTQPRPPMGTLIEDASRRQNDRMSQPPSIRQSLQIMLSGAASYCEAFDQRLQQTFRRAGLPVPERTRGQELANTLRRFAGTISDEKR